jgi:hypothetical protein
LWEYNAVVSSIQVFFRKNGEVSYARARHFGADKKFYYHQQSLEYTNKKLRELATIDPCQAFDSKSIGHTVVESSPELKSRFKLVELPVPEPKWVQNLWLQIFTF